MEVQWHQKEAEQAAEEASWLKRKRKKWFSWETAYRYSSGYGEDYAWAGTVLALMLLGFTAVYWLLDVPSVMRGEPGWKQALHSLLYSFQVATLGRVEFYPEKVRLAARCFHLAESVLVPVQFGFFLFALRNRFRR
jgi:hypothetical protein